MFYLESLHELLQYGVYSINSTEAVEFFLEPVMPFIHSIPYGTVRYCTVSSRNKKVKSPMFLCFLQLFV